MCRPLFVLLTLFISTGLFLHQGHAADSWTKSKPVDISEAKKQVSAAAKKDPSLLKNPTILAYKTALFLASKSLDTGTLGQKQSISAEFTGGEEVFSSAVVTVEFMGYADDSLFGERFKVHVKKMGNTNVWKVTKVERAAYGRGDQR